MDAANIVHVTSGRIAFAMALRDMGIGPGDKVLMPAWNSPAMIPPVLHCGAQPSFYRLRGNAEVDLADVATRLTEGARLLVVVHYFGFLQPMDDLRAFCDRHGLALLEDCAHSFFSERDGRPSGSWGDYAIASSMKFFPLYDGGCLLSRHRLRQTTWAGPGFEAKSLLAALEKAHNCDRLLLTKLVTWLPMRLRALSRSDKSRPLSPCSSDSGLDFEPCWIDRRRSLFTRAVMRLACHGRIVTRRRANYHRLEQALAGVEGCRPLFPRLAVGTCPWMLPVLFDDPDAVADRLEQAGVPYTRFGPPCHTEVSAAFSNRVIAFPCHQELREDEIAWLCQTIPEVVRA